MTCSTDFFISMFVTAVLAFALAWFYGRLELDALKGKTNSLNTALASLQEDRSKLIQLNDEFKRICEQQKSREEIFKGQIASLESGINRLEKDNQLILREYKLLERVIREQTLVS